MHLGRAGVEEHAHDLPRRVAAHDRVVDGDDALARDLRDRVVLEPDPLAAQLLVGLDERALDVAVLDQPLAEGEAEPSREADGRRRAGIRDRQHEVGLDRRLGREAFAHPHPRAVHLDALERRVGAREVEELPDAERSARGGLERLHGTEPARVGDDDLARLDLAHHLGADEVESTRLGGDHPGFRAVGGDQVSLPGAGGSAADAAGVDPAEHERTEAVRVAEGDQPPLREGDDRVRAVEPPHRARSGLLERVGVVRDQRRDQLAVGGRSQRDALGPQLVAELADVDEVPVVAERDRADGPVLHQRLRVRPLRGARRRVARVADRDLAAEAVELLLVEDLRHEPEVAQRRQPAVLRDRDPGRFLAAVLEREEAEVREPRDVAVGGVDAEDAAHG